MAFSLTSFKEYGRLARVRENQRKGQARKQEYVRELEQRLAAFQEEAQRMDIANRIAIQKIEAENRHMRNLLLSLGFSADPIKHYLPLADQDTIADRKVAIPVMNRPADASSEASCKAACSTSPHVASSDPNEEEASAEQPPVNDNVQLPTSTIPPQKFTEFQQKCKIHLCQSSTEQFGSELWPPNQDVFNTTLCAVADELLGQYNTQRVDMDELRRRICSGYTKETDLDCCRVQNNVLFQILDEISSEKPA